MSVMGGELELVDRAVSTATAAMIPNVPKLTTAAWKYIVADQPGADLCDECIVHHRLRFPLDPSV